MKRSITLTFATAVVVASALTACSTTSPTPTEAPTLGTASTIDDVVAAFTEAGGACDWQETDVVVAAAQSGQCSDAVTIATFTSSDARDTTVATIKAIGHAHVLVGPNWIINAYGDEVDSLVSALGGQLVVAP